MYDAVEEGLRLLNVINQTVNKISLKLTIRYFFNSVIECIKL